VPYRQNGTKGQQEPCSLTVGKKGKRGLEIGVAVVRRPCFPLSVMIQTLSVMIQTL